MNIAFRFFLLAALLLGAVRLTAADSMDMKNDMKGEVLSAYLKVSSALAADDLAAAKSAAATLAEHARTGGKRDIADKADALAKASKIEAARGAFKTLSVAVEPLAMGDKAYIVMYCPMADSDWIQTSAKVQNPYFGKAMLTCGGPKKAK